MSTRCRSAEVTQTREQRIEALLQELRPTVEATVRQLVERAVDVPEAEEFGAIDFEFRERDPLRTRGRSAADSLARRDRAGAGGCRRAEALRKLVGYFENNRHRTDYPTYRQKGWDIGSGPTEAGCKIIGARLKGSGMRWVEDGAATVATLRALYVSGGKLWDGFWEQPYAIAV
jgi:hypothetical protein